MESLNYNKLNEILNELSKKKYRGLILENQKYNEQYRFFSTFPKMKMQENGGRLTEKDLYIIIGYTFAWMPRQMTLFNNMDKEHIEFINNAPHMNNNDLEDGIEHLSKLMFKTQNAIVAITKLLHFVYPQEFPIFDNKVKDQLNTITSNSFNISTRNYILFKDHLHNLQKDEIKSEAIIENTTVLMNIDYKIYLMRAIDILLYLNAKKAEKN